MKEIRVSSWTELQEELYAGSWHEPLGRFRSDFAFRGMSRADSALTTSLVRLGGDAHELERHLLRNFRKYAARGEVPVDSVWNWLALGQHHGLPTRLLDWTYSPYVALHFLTANLDLYDVDGTVWCVDYVQMHRLAPEKLRRCLEEEGANVFTTEMLDRVARDLGEYPALGLDEWLRRHPDLGRRIVVPAELKWEIRDKLDQANVTERVLFPGLDGISRWVARYYTPRADRPRA